MQRADFQKIATPVDRLEYRKWARRVSVFYGVLLLGGLSFAIAYHHQSPSHSAATAAAFSTTSIAAINQFDR